VKIWSKLFPIIFLIAAALPLIEASLIAAQSRSAPENPLLNLRGLVSMCQRTDPTSTVACGSYITGFIAGSQATQNSAVVHAVGDMVVSGRVPPSDTAIEDAAKILRERWKPFCIRSNWTAGYVQAVIVQYGREHAERLDEAAADEMLKILARAFPCSEAR
jgi:hypothetical protein